jgi:hypothetical protein
MQKKTGWRFIRNPDYSFGNETGLQDQTGKDSADQTGFSLRFFRTYEGCEDYCPFEIQFREIRWLDGRQRVFGHKQ